MVPAMAKKAHKQQASALDELTSNSEGAWLDSADPPRLEGMRRRNFIAGSRSALRRQSSMQRLDYGRLIVGLVALAVVIGVSWIALEYLVPSPPSSVTIATGGKGTTFDYFGERYRARFARAGIEILAQTLKEEHSGAGLFQRSGEFPATNDPEYTMSSVAVEYYRNGPSLLAKYLPLWRTTYVERTIAFLVTTLAIVFPVFGIAPRLYEWFVRQRFRQFYQRSRLIQASRDITLTQASEAEDQ
jgi:hypothetical protein